MVQKKQQLIDLPLEEVIGDRFGRYSKYIIQDRALPDVRDGLKPVQRRILYAMHEDKNTHDKNFRKAAKTVGTVIGNYHPHGDTSVYDAMVRLSQNWKMRNELIEMHGNNGSIDGDPPAAMRYTEARLAKISSELIRDIEKETVDFIPNFDDTLNEPTVFPAKLPNLLMNGSTGISAGYATNIPPHNLKEVIDAVILKMDRPNVTVEQLMEKIKGPDFPTGGIIQGKEGIKQAFQTGKGRVVLRGKTTIENIKGGREQIIVHEIPYDVNKANLVRKIDELHADRKVEGISEVRDESDRTGLRVVIELKKGVNAEGILHFLFKNTDLQVLYHYNMVAIKDKTPKLLSLPDILDAYINHQQDVVTRQTTFDLQKAKDRAHIVAGLIKAISILDELIAMIRSSKNKADAKKNIMREFQFSEIQAEAILSLQLYRLTNTDITLLIEEQNELRDQIVTYETILADPKKLQQTIKKDLRRIQKTYSTVRMSTIEAEIEEIKIDIEVTVPSETVLVSVTREGYVKRTSIRSYGASKQDDLLMKPGDNLIKLLEMDTTDHLLLFTNLGKYVSIPVYELPEIRWKDMGNHLSNMTTFEANEHVVQCIPVRDFDKGGFLLFATRNGMLKKTELKQYVATRYSRSLIALNLRETDELVGVYQTDGNQDFFLASHFGFGLWINEAEISPVGLRALGVIGISLKDDDYVVNVQPIDEARKPNLVILTQRGACKRMMLKVFQKSQRARRGVAMLRELKTKPHRICSFITLHEPESIIIYTDQNKQLEIDPFGLPNSERNSNGSFVFDPGAEGHIIYAAKQVLYETPFK